MPKVAIAADFLESFAQIPHAQHKKVREFVKKFQANPTSHSINYEPIHDMRDKRVRTVRIGLDYRAIILHPQKGDVYVLLWVDHHDEATDWAKNKLFPVNPVTGALQIVDTEAVSEVVTAVQAEAPPKSLAEYGLFETFAAEDLLRIGLPSVLLPAVQNIQTAEQLEKLKPYLPDEAYEALFWIANFGYSIAQALQEVAVSRPQPQTVDVDDVEAALQHPDSQRRFTIVESEGDLEEMLNAPLEKWRVFLHPSQADLVKRHYNGPARALGGAGTGKTVVAMHRARHLARRVFTAPEDRILFVTFTRTLAHNISQNLDHLCGSERNRIEVIHLHKWAMDYLKSHKIYLRVASKDEIAQCWREAIQEMSNAAFGLGFYRAEWGNVIKANHITSKGDYLRVSRRGQGSRLSRLQRAGVWAVFEKYRAGLQQLGKVEWNDIPIQARQRLEQHGSDLPYRAVIVDEVQDLYPEELRLIRQIVPKGPNDLLLVGDAHQRIYSTVPVVMSRCGINIRGRSRKLRINYRTTEKIRNWSMGILAGIAIDDMDGAADDHTASYISLRKGVAPTIKHFPTLAQERMFIIEQIERLVIMEDVPSESICIVAREGRQIPNYTRGLTSAGIPHLYLSRDVTDDAGEGVRLAT
ncbi:MAG: UvrD-helicase domain-containing protein, partial [Anaerolineae bacterium]